eukprot:200836-Chlamydomonas_euryale.AAC.4
MEVLLMTFWHHYRVGPISHRNIVSHGRKACGQQHHVDLAVVAQQLRPEAVNVSRQAAARVARKSGRLVLKRLTKAPPVPPPPCDVSQESAALTTESSANSMLAAMGFEVMASCGCGCGWGGCVAAFIAVAAVLTAWPVDSSGCRAAAEWYAAAVAITRVAAMACTGCASVRKNWTAAAAAPASGTCASSGAASYASPAAAARERACVASTASAEATRGASRLPRAGCHSARPAAAAHFHNERRRARCRAR